jgi:hypothetical protein
MRRTASSIALVLALGTGSVSAQGPVESRLASRLDARTRSTVAAIIDSARAASLPVEPLVDKALEGAAKKATGQQIISAVRTFYVQLGEAKRALGTGSTDLELLGGAQAIRAGIPVQQIERLRRARSGVQIATALTVASDLVSREVPVDTAVAVVASLVGASATDDQLLAVRGEIENDILTGKPPAVAASTRGQALEATLAQSTPPNGAGDGGSLNSPRGTSRTGDGLGILKPPGQANGGVSPAGAPPKPPVSQRKRPSP